MDREGTPLCKPGNYPSESWGRVARGAGVRDNECPHWALKRTPTTDRRKGRPGSRLRRPIRTNPQVGWPGSRAACPAQRSSHNQGGLPSININMFLPQDYSLKGRGGWEERRGDGWACGGAHSWVQRVGLHPWSPCSVGKYTDNKKNMANGCVIIPSLSA